MRRLGLTRVDGVQGFGDRPDIMLRQKLAECSSIKFATTASEPVAFSLKVRTLVAHTGVSTLGKMLSTTVSPAQSDPDFSLRSAATRVKSGALLPTSGRSAEVLMGLPSQTRLATSRRQTAGRLVPLPRCLGDTGDGRATRSRRHGVYKDALANAGFEGIAHHQIHTHAEKI